MLIKVGDSHRWLLYICKIMVATIGIACFLIQGGVTPSSYEILVGVGGFLSGCLIQLAIDNFTNVSLA